MRNLAHVENTHSPKGAIMASIYANSHPAAMGEVVKQGHVDYCRDNGHATYVVDGIDQGYCSRCGEAQAVEAVEVDACLDCAQYVAGISEHERGEAYPAATVAAMTRYTPGQLVDGDCGEENEHCVDFTDRPCDLCDSGLAGERHRVAIISH